jgi:hypothetical protein
MNEMPSDTAMIDQKLVGIGGWLVVPAIGLVLAPIIMVVSLVMSVGLASDVARQGYGGIHALEMLYAFGMLIFIIYAAMRFFGKRSNAPSIMIALYVVQLVSEGVLLMIELGADAEPFAIESGKALVRSAMGAAIWIPYFRVSKRVKATFVN